MTMGHDDKVIWEQDSWAAGVEHGKSEAKTSAETRHAAELKLISTLLTGLKMTADAHQAQLTRMQTTLDRSLAQLQAMLAPPAGMNTVHEVPVAAVPHVAELAPDRDANPIFDAGGREIDLGAPGKSLGYPLFSTCRCGRQIFQPSYGKPWGHSD